MKTIKISLAFSILFFFSNYSSNAQDTINPYNPEAKMELLKSKKKGKVDKMHFLVFGDSKGSQHFASVLKRADSLQPEFCITTADLVDYGGGSKGKRDYKKLDEVGGWFMRKYPMWPTVGNHEEAGGRDGIENFSNFFGMKKDMYSFEYGNAKFIALPWPKIKENEDKLIWLEKELENAKGKHIFVFRHRPFYTVGYKSSRDVENKETNVTKLFDKYNVTAVFAGHDHVYYRTKRSNTNYIISAGAGATIYPLRKEMNAIDGDVYYGARTEDEIKESLSLPTINFNNSRGDNIEMSNAKFYINSIKMEGNKVFVELIKEDDVSLYKFRAADGTITDIPNAMFYVVSVKIDGEKVSIEMIDAKTGKIWDKARIK